MSRLTRRLIVGLGDAPLELVVPPGQRVDVGLDWSRVLNGAAIALSSWTAIDGAVSFVQADYSDQLTWGNLEALESGMAVRLVNTIETSRGAIVSRAITIRVRE